MMPALDPADVEAIAASWSDAHDDGAPAPTPWADCHPTWRTEMTAHVQEMLAAVESAGYRVVKA